MSTPFTGVLPRGWSTCFVDIESTFCGDHTLRKQTVEEYVRDLHFEVLALSILRDDEEEVEVVGPEEVRGLLESVDWSRTLGVAHNAAFDFFAIHEHYGVHPAMVADTLSMARCCFPNLAGGYSLEVLCKTFELGAGKLGTVEAYECYRSGDLKGPVLDAFLRYCAQDVFLLRALYRRLLREGISREEMNSMDAILQASTRPALALDAEKVAAYCEEMEARYRGIAHLAEDDCFAEALREHGIEPPRKGGGLYCFAKVDDFMLGLNQHEDEKVRKLVADREEANSSSERTKAIRFRGIACRGSLPASIVPHGAHTGRDSGGGKLNLQNLKRGSPLRKAIVAGEWGNLLVVVDASQIEARILNHIVGETWVTEAFRDGEDVYALSGTRMFGRPVSKDETPELRFRAKVVELASGYGMGAGALSAQMAQAGDPQDMDWCKQMIGAYRDTHPRVVSLWGYMDTLARQIMGGTPDGKWRDAGLPGVSLEYRKDQLRLPSGRVLVYPGMREENGRLFHSRLRRRDMVEVPTWGGKLAENLVQALARDCTFHHDVLIRRLFQEPVRLAMRVHDELVYSIDGDSAGSLLEFAIERMRQPPSWLEGCPLDAEGAFGRSWGDAK